MYAPERGYVVYCTECYASDKWDSFSYGRDYNFEKPFFAQLEELIKKLPVAPFTKTSW